jgi:hypothetical protein
MAFQEVDAAVFFGRDTEIQEGLELLNRLHQFGGARIMMILGSSFSPSGDLVVTASSDGTARIWSLYASDLQKAIKDATNICLDPEFRERSLGESWEEATRKYEQCEREHGRNP